MRKLPARLKMIFILIYFLTVVSVFISIKLQYIQMDTSFRIGDVILFAFVISLTESLTVLYKNISLSTSFAIYLSVFFVFGPLFTIIVMILGFSFRVLREQEKIKHIFNTPFYGTLFNYCALIFPIVFANFIYILVGGGNPPNLHSVGISNFVLFSLAFFLMNTLIVSSVISISSNKSLWFVYLNNMRLSFLNTILMAPFGLLLAHLYVRYGYVGVLSIFFPMALARYTFILYVNVRTQYLQTIDTLMKAIEARDQYTEGHSQRVGDIAIKIAKEMKYNDFQMEQLKIASLLHDVGKIGVEDSILNKPGMLSKEEFSKIKVHPQKGYDILKQIKNLEKILPVVLHHHERYDGKGYPSGKGVDELSLDVFIVQLADAVDAMATDRPYRSALSQKQIISEITENSGTQFHPKVVEAYLRVREKEERLGL
jgi:HD-GYP domain-containing protein (c-di-GMP phosphodiesterase class II)